MSPPPSPPQPKHYGEASLPRGSQGLLRHGSAALERRGARSQSARVPAVTRRRVCVVETEVETRMPPPPSRPDALTPSRDAAHSYCPLSLQARLAAL